MDNKHALPLKQAHMGWTGPIAASVCLPLLFITIMLLFTTLVMPEVGPLGSVVGALAAALLLSRIERSMNWRNVALVTFWFVLAGCVGGTCIIVGGALGINNLVAGCIGLAVMVLIQGGRVLWQFRRARGRR
ncbi:MAG: hypothetical protein M3R24_01200 [Chloroflexota bacterium]|nr:hypothetical protein [Chloroflexota bacterium]